MAAGSATVYSPRLGAITDAQLAAAAARLGLGGFVSAAPASGGLFGQNLFLTTSAGAFVLRGAPHWMGGMEDPDYRRLGYRHQFAKEAFFVDQAHERTGAPVPWPYRRDEVDDIFGWPYVVMPRMPGTTFSERAILKALAPESRREVAEAAGATLAELQRLTWSFSGDFDPQTLALTPNPDGDLTRIIGGMRASAASAQANSLMTPGDMDWVETIARDAAGLPGRPISFVHGDYKLENMTVVEGAGGWGIGGVFDFHTARFGDGAADLARQACAYLDTEPAMAGVFIDAYRRDVETGDDLALWAPLYVASERIGIWDYFVRADPRPAWSLGKTFRAWAEPYVERTLALLRR
jgi:hygromycin-B 7''-O-kinase